MNSISRGVLRLVVAGALSACTVLYPPSQATHRNIDKIEVIASAMQQELIICEPAVNACRMGGDCQPANVCIGNLAGLYSEGHAVAAELRSETVYLDHSDPLWGRCEIAAKQAREVSARYKALRLRMGLAEPSVPDAGER